MKIILLLALQGAAATSPAPLADIDFDLRKVEPAKSDGGAIVVTARRVDRRLQPLAEIPDDTVPVAETGITGNLRAGATLEQRDLGNGMVSKGVMVTLKLPF